MLQPMWTWLNAHASPLQAIAAIVTALATLVLIIVTIQYVRATLQIVRLSGGQLKASLHPQVLPEFSEDWREDGTDFCRFSLRNVGQYYFKVLRVEALYSCAVTASPSHFGGGWDLSELVGRIVPAGDKTSLEFSINPLKECAEHEPHAKPCKWIFRFSITVEDLFGLGEHEYEFDNVAGLQAPPPLEITFDTSWLGMKKLAWERRTTQLRVKVVKAWEWVRERARY